MQSGSTSVATVAGCSLVTVAAGAVVAESGATGVTTKNNTVRIVVSIGGYLRGECRLTIGEPRRTARINID
jgi:hypothetical protein